VITEEDNKRAQELAQFSMVVVQEWEEEEGVCGGVHINEGRIQEMLGDACDPNVKFKFEDAERERRNRVGSVRREFVEYVELRDALIDEGGKGE